MYYLVKAILFAMFLFLFGWGNKALAQSFSAKGTIDYIDSKYQKIGIGDSVMPFAVNLKVARENGSFADRYALRQGDHVRITYRKSGDTFFVETVKILNAP